MKDLRERNALLTGASRGLGPYIGRALAEQGVNVALTARGADSLATTAGELGNLGIRAVSIPADITDPSARESLLEAYIDFEEANIDLEAVSKGTGFGRGGRAFRF